MKLIIFLLLLWGTFELQPWSDSADNKKVFFWAITMGLYFFKILPAKDL
jgi:hypothetical protein